jgi:hypothetical protein
MRVEAVGIGHVHQIWPMVEGFIDSALKFSKGDYDTQAAKVFVSTGQWSLLVAVDDQGVQGAATVSFFNRPHDRVAFITAIGGKLISSPETFAQLKQILSQYGATCIEGAARDSIARLWTRYGFLEKYKIVGVSI